MKKLIAKGDDTPKNLFDLAALCDQCGMTKEAAQAYAYILRKGNAPEEMMKRLAPILEKMQLWPEAASAYQKLQLTNPADADLQARATACAEKAKTAAPVKFTDFEAGNEPVAKAPDNAEPPKDPDGGAKPPDQAPQPQPAKAEPARDGMEASTLWQIEQWGNAATCEVVTDPKDNKILNVAWTQKDKDKVALRMNADMNLTDKAKVTFDVFNNSTAPTQICMAFNTLPNYQFFESVAFPTPLKKWETITIDLAAKNFKCAATNWKYVSEIGNKESVKDIFILIYNQNPAGAMFIDNIRFHLNDE